MATIRTFGDLMKQQPWSFSEFSYPHGLSYQVCKQCKRGRGSGLRGLWSYSVRAHICADCIKKRKDEVLPGVVKSEKFDAKMRGISQQARAAVAIRR